MVNDRGSIKWTSLMLPEHVELLKTIWNEDKLIRKPLLDEQELEILNNKMMEAYQDMQPIKVKYYQQGKIVEVSGVIKEFDQLSQKVLVKDINEETTAISFQAIYQIE